MERTEGLVKPEPSQYIHFPGLKWYVIDIGVARSEKGRDWVAAGGVYFGFSGLHSLVHRADTRDKAIVGVMLDLYHSWRSRLRPAAPGVRADFVLPPDLPPASQARASVILPQVGWGRLVISYDYVRPLDNPHRVWLDATLPDGPTFEGKGKAGTFDAGIDLCCEEIRLQIKGGVT